MNLTCKLIFILVCRWCGHRTTLVWTWFWQVAATIRTRFVPACGGGNSETSHTRCSFCWSPLDTTSVCVRFEDIKFSSHVTLVSRDLCNVRWHGLVFGSLKAMLKFDRETAGWKISLKNVTKFRLMAFQFVCFATRLMKLPSAKFIHELFQNSHVGLPRHPHTHTIYAR